MVSKLMPTSDNDHEFSGVNNFRDLGGYAAADGRRVQYGRVYRSDELSELNRADLEKLSRLGLKSIVDFRGVEEAGDSPDRLPEGAKLIALPVEAGQVMQLHWHGLPTHSKSLGMMVSVYKALATDFQDTYREFFKLLANPDHTPLLFHCAAGKDRTGFAAALFLSSLGVERELVMSDYLISRQRLQKKYRLGVDYNFEVEPLFMVYPEFLEASFERIDNDYGGMDAYLRERLGVNIEWMRTEYTEPLAGG